MFKKSSRYIKRHFENAIFEINSWKFSSMHAYGIKLIDSISAYINIKKVYMVFKKLVNF